MSEKRENKDIELRSEKVRNIVGKIPPCMLRTGMSIIALIIISIFILAYFIPYPEYKIIPINLYSNLPIQIIKASDSGILCLDVEGYVEQGTQIGWIKNQNDSILKFYSKISGTIVLNSSNGDFIQNNKIILSIIPDSIKSVYAIGFIPFDEINTINEGQDISAGYENKTIKGKINKIYPIPEFSSKGERCYKVEIVFANILNDNQKSFLLPNVINTGKVLITNKPILRQILGVY